jgi:uncharacterized cupredoxin-like copper-binding protein
MNILPLALLFAASATLAAEQTAFGIAGDPAKATRTITIDMSDDMRYAPAAIDVKQGETVRFVVANKGATAHELVLGTKRDIEKHAKAMKSASASGGHAGHMHHMHHVHATPSMVHLEAGKSDEIVWRFNRAGTFVYACLLPGHYEAGMKGSITVK